MSFPARGSTGSISGQTQVLVWAAAISAAFGTSFACLSFVWAFPFDVRWFAPLACAWFDLFIVANGARLGQQGRAVRVRTASGALLLRTAWRAARRKRGSMAFFVALRSSSWFSWQPWGALVCACVALASTAAAWLPLPPATLIHALISPALPIADCAVLTMLAFVTLVAERTCHAQAERMPVFASLARMFRVVLVVTIAAAASSAWLAYAGSVPNWPLRAAAVFSAAIGRCSISARRPRCG